MGVKVRVMGGDGGTDVGWKENSWSGAVEGGRGCHIVKVELTVGEKERHDRADGRGHSGGAVGGRWWVAKRRK